MSDVAIPDFGQLHLTTRVCDYDGALARDGLLLDYVCTQDIVVVGNGRNNRLMLAAVALGIGVVGDEGMAAEAQQASDVVVRHNVDAFELLFEPRRLVGTLRG